MYKKEQSPRTGLLFTSKLFVFGFIYHLFSNSNQESVSIYAKTGQDVFNIMIQMNISNKRPIFIIDECIPINEDSILILDLFEIAFVH